MFKNILTIQIKNNNKINIIFMLINYIIIIRIIALIFVLQRTLCCIYNFNV